MVKARGKTTLSGAWTPCSASWTQIQLHWCYSSRHLNLRNTGTLVPLAVSFFEHQAVSLYVATTEQLEFAMQAIAECLRTSASSIGVDFEPEPEPGADSSTLTKHQSVILMGTKFGAGDLSLVQLATSESVV